jgi:uncharacterized cupin superfamily protein
LKRATLDLFGRWMGVPGVGSLAPTRVAMDQQQVTSSLLPQVLDGDPVARAVPLITSADDCFSATLWTCSPGRFRWFYRSDEMIHLLEGEVFVTPDQAGDPFLMVEGDVIYFPLGSSAVWEVRRPVRKLALFRSEAGDPLARLRSKLTPGRQTSSPTPKAKRNGP